jgi:hypothetical protein
MRAGFALAVMAVHAAWAGETCRYSGATSYSGRVSVETKATAANGETTVDVAARVSARSFGLIDWRYLYQEIGTWRDSELRSVGVNHRYSVAGSIQRQLWDVFNRTPDGMAGYRVLGTTLADFQAKHPGFVRHWDPASFGEPWLPDYASAPPERRADLDLPRASMPPGLGTPLLLAFYWVRWAGQQERTVPVFLPGFKHDARADIRVHPMGIDRDGLLHLHSSVRHPQLSETEVSTGDAWISPDHHLVRVAFNARGDHASAQGELHLEGCQGTP